MVEGGGGGPAEDEWIGSLDMTFAFYSAQSRAADFCRSFGNVSLADREKLPRGLTASYAKLSTHTNRTREKRDGRKERRPDSDPVAWDQSQAPKRRL
jgi:hypothetical protein